MKSPIRREGAVCCHCEPSQSVSPSVINGLTFTGTSGYSMMRQLATNEAVAMMMMPFPLEHVCRQHRRGTIPRLATKCGIRAARSEVFVR
eukprot:3912862-Rhodomonas_salina.1